MEPIVVKITGDTTGLQAAASGATGKMGGLQGMLGSVGSALMGPAGIATMAVGAAVALGDLTMAAAADRDEQNKLLAAIDAAGAATADSTAQVEDAIAAGQDLAFTDSETRAALLPLIQSTGDVEEATKLMGTAQDIARLKGIDLETAANAVAKASEGQDGALKRLLPSLNSVADDTDIVAEAQKLAAGQAELFGSTAEGQAMKAKDSMGELGESLGSVFLPILDELVPAILPFVELLGDLIKAVIPVLIPLVKGIVTAFRGVIDIMGKVVDAIKKVLDWIGDLITKVKSGLDQLHDLVNFDLPHFDLPDLNPFDNPAATGRGRGPVTVYINTGADPNAVGRAVRSYIDMNGPIT